MTTLLPWAQRPQLTGSIINPALVSAVITWCATRYSAEARTDMPWEISYLIPPLTLHSESRHSLPRTVRTHLASWVSSNPTVLVSFADRARRFRPHVNEGLRFGLRTGLLTMSPDGYLVAHIPQATKVGTTTEVDEILRAAATLGAVLGRAGSSSNIYTILGVSP